MAAYHLRMARRGPALLAVDRWIEGLTAPDAALVAMARGLARSFDDEPAAAVARELRATLKALAPAGDVDRQGAVVSLIRGPVRTTAVGDS